MFDKWKGWAHNIVKVIVTIPKIIIFVIYNKRAGETKLEHDHLHLIQF